MKLNLGCGNAILDGWVNVDKVATPRCDAAVDLESLPWPWPDDSVDEVLLNHVLEHLGATSATFLGIIKELWRVCRHDALIHIRVPHPRHDHFLWDPTHVRAITWEGLRMFNQQENRAWIAAGNAMTPLGLYIGVDFRIDKVVIHLDETWAARKREGTISDADLAFAIRHYNNVVQQTDILWRANKKGETGNV